MTIFKRFPVAVVICALVIVLCCVWGYSRVYEPPAEAGGGSLRFEKPSDLEASGYSKVGRSVLDASTLRALGCRLPPLPRSPPSAPSKLHRPRPRFRLTLTSAPPLFDASPFFPLFSSLALIKPSTD